MLKTLLPASQYQSNKVVDKNEAENINDDVEFLFKSEKSKSSIKLSKSQSIGEKFLTSKAKKTFIQLKLGFIETSILQHFDPEYHIWIETNGLGYAINGILSQQTLNNLG